MPESARALSYMSFIPLYILYDQNISELFKSEMGNKSEKPPITQFEYNYNVQFCLIGAHWI